jgi:hypothetical protein
MSLLGWSKTSHSLEAPEDDGGWSSAEEPINSSDAEEDGGVDPKKLVNLGLSVGSSGWVLCPMGRNVLEDPPWPQPSLSSLSSAKAL